MDSTAHKMTKPQTILKRDGPFKAMKQIKMIFKDFLSSNTHNKTK